jgi:hypothetical protein
MDAPDTLLIEADLNRAIYAVHGLSGLLVALARSPDTDALNFEQIGELVSVIARDLDRARDRVLPHLHAA